MSSADAQRWHGPVSTLIGRRVGQYRPVGVLGSGGMATVYWAYQASLDRHVAVKVLHPQLTVDPVLVERFLREARTAARLNHPNIITIHDVGEADGTYYIAMRLVTGETLQDLVRRNGALPTDRVVAILQQLISALAYAHRQGVVHRDVKPSNVMLEQADRATLMDFGIVRAAEESRLTRTGTIVGTPEYMSPEQAEGGQVDHRTDIYSLGVISYEMLTGQVPFSGTTPLAVLHKVVYEPPPALSTLVSAISPELEGFVQCALAKKAEDRYQSASEMGAALERAAALSEPSARGSAAISYREEAAPKLMVGQVQQKEESELAATVSAAKSVTQVHAFELARKMQWRLPWPLLAAALLALVVVAVSALSRGQTATSPPITARNAAQARVCGVLDEHDGQVRSAAFSPDGRLITSGLSNGTVSLWQVADGSFVGSLDERGPKVNSVAFSPDGGLLTAGLSDGTVSLWRVSNGSFVRSLDERGPEVNSVAFSPDGRLLATGLSDGTVSVWRVSNGSFVRSLDERGAEVNGIAFSPDGRLLATGLSDGTVSLWRVSNGSFVRSLDERGAEVNSVAFSPDGSLLATGLSDGTASLWRVSSGSFLRSLDQNASTVYGVAFSPSGELLASALSDGAVWLWQVSGGNFVTPLSQGRGPVRGVAFSPRGSLLVAASADHVVTVWCVT